MIHFPSIKYTRPCLLPHPLLAAGAAAPGGAGRAAAGADCGGAGVQRGLQASQWTPALQRSGADLEPAGAAESAGWGGSSGTERHQQAQQGGGPWAAKHSKPGQRQQRTAQQPPSWTVTSAAGPSWRAGSEPPAHAARQRSGPGLPARRRGCAHAPRQQVAARQPQRQRRRRASAGHAPRHWIRAGFAPGAHAAGRAAGAACR